MLAINAKVYWRSGGSYGAPNWTEAAIIENFAVNPAWDQAETNSRASRIKLQAKSLLGLEFSGRMEKKPGNASYEAFMNALLTDDVIDLLVLDGPKEQVGVRGWRVDCQVFSANENQDLANALYPEITFMPTSSDNAPKAVKVGPGPALTYSIPGASGASFS
ncbi:unnamed protein product [Gemmata massiliana]|uniref:Phage tail protein n=1 Tax=Gemmata massiliana TaxID=1210884 RepID=A0A6P2DGW4_9BACT|nr:hypothetical protein [Gemmata massiliana]VTS01562.1 unnamed protein product [Gemmata massiliana]